MKLVHSQHVSRKIVLVMVNEHLQELAQNITYMHLIFFVAYEYLLRRTNVSFTLLPADRNYTFYYVIQGIFLHIDCVPFWDAAPFHWDAAPPDFQSLRPKRKKTCCHVMPAFFCTMSIPFFTDSQFSITRSHGFLFTASQKKNVLPRHACIYMHYVSPTTLSSPFLCPAVHSALSSTLSRS